MPEAVGRERKFHEFFLNVKAFLRQCDIKDTVQKWNAKDYELDALLTTTTTQVHERLSDNFDTPSALDHLSELVTSTNAYLQQDKKLIKIPLVNKISKYVFKMMKCFGVYDEDIVPSTN